MKTNWREQMKTAFQDYGERTALNKAEQLKKLHPKQNIYIIFDYEERRHDAITQKEAEDLQFVDWDFTIIYTI